LPESNQASVLDVISAIRFVNLGLFKPRRRNRYSVLKSIRKLRESDLGQMKNLLSIMPFLRPEPPNKNILEVINSLFL